MTTLLLALVLSAPQETFADRLVLACRAYGKNIIAIRDESGRILWSHKNRGGQHDVQMLENGNIFYQDGWRKLVKITLDKKVGWRFRDFMSFGNGLAAGVGLTEAQAKLVREKLASRK